MTWNHRVIRRVNEQGEEYYAIHEVYYNEDNEPHMVTEEAVSPFGETLEELEQDMEWFIKAMRHPVLNYEEIRE